MTTTQTIPAERIRPGYATQTVNVIDRDGSFSRQARFWGTEEQARAYAKMQVLHETDPEFPALRKLAAEALAERARRRRARR